MPSKHKAPHGAGDRFQIERVLGRGGMSVVYQAFDCERSERVAIKTMNPGESHAIARLKREFRALADLRHPNLVLIHELIGDDSDCWLIMEIIVGCDFLSYVRGTQQVMGTGHRSRTGLASRVQTTPPTEQFRIVPHSIFDESRLRAALAQLTDGLDALHEAGQVHRDIKPSNVMVTPTGRLVILDFGIVTEKAAAPLIQHDIAGTPAYMAPEQSLAQAPRTPASDWYSVGVMLYEALTNQRLFRGPAAAILATKQSTDLPPPSALNPGVPEDLDRLCVALLNREPEMRPTGREIRQICQLDRFMSRPQPTPRTASVVDKGRFVGRIEYLMTLENRLDLVQRGVPGLVLVHGTSGIGKTALIQQFLRGVTNRGAAVVLASRCYERVSVPYQAVDSLVEALCSHLAQLPQDILEAVTPLHVAALLRVFPTLGTIDVLCAVQQRSRPAPEEPLYLRTLAFAALRELLARLAEQAPLILFIDDLQWGDVDSIPLLKSLMAAPTPPLLFIASFREEDAQASPIVAALRHGDEFPVDIAVPPLSDDEARQLIEGILIASGTARSDSLVRQLANESGGSPYFAHELAHHAASSPTLKAPTLDALIRIRVAQLSNEACKLLEAIAVAGRPITRPMMADVTQLSGLARVLDELCQAKLVRIEASDAAPVECYHDRIRKIILDHMSHETRREWHRLIAASLEQQEPSDVAALLFHLMGAEEPKRAQFYVRSAADRAAAALAFDHAATLYQRALELARVHSTVEMRAEMGAKLGDALASAGHGDAAARAYLAAAEHAAEPLVLQAKAANQLLHSGDTAAGLALIEKTLPEVGISLASGQRRAGLALLARRAYLRVRGLRFAPRTLDELPDATQVRLNVSWHAAIGIAMVDIVRGAHLQAQHLHATLRAGEPMHIGRALVYEIGYLSGDSARAERRIRRIVHQLGRITERVNSPDLRAMYMGSQALFSYKLGRWRESRTLAERSERVFREECANVSWEAMSMRLIHISALYYLGALRELTERVSQGVETARARGDRYALACLHAGLPSITGLIKDQPEETAQRLRETISMWGNQSFQLQHYWAFLGGLQCELYASDANAAYARVEEQWPRLKRSFLLQVPLVAIESWFSRGRATLALAAARLGTHPLEAKRLLGAATRDARRLRRRREGWSRALGTLLAGGIAHMKGDRDIALERLIDATLAFERLDMALYAMVGRRRYGQILGGDEGAGSIGVADAWMGAQGIERPDRVANMLLPTAPSM